MEGMRHRTGTRGAEPRATHKPAASLAEGSSQQSQQLDEELFRRADAVAQDLQQMAAPTSKPKRAALAAQGAHEKRAARFFATHGMGKIGELLGEKLSASEVAEAQEEERDQQQLENLGLTASVDVRKAPALRKSFAP